jgi:WD40 repeat protein
MGLIDSGNVAVVQLPEDEQGEVNVLATFQLRQAAAGRAVVSLSKRSRRRERKRAAHKDEDVEMANGDADADEDSSDDDDVELGESSWVSCIASSADGQWLAVSNLAAQVVIYNMDTLKVSWGYTYL